ncbi:YoaK family protein [Rhizorhabdus sp.]|uniref:YoaK family protein n=1 Tax=Rhizorhabdus sp. TaxID=1968843 RepID=UPI0019BE2B15|nr:YoaK family protein [Rhizorhabdus sp.]MBD3761894.1 DUF1275 domain-containing protein [Rhizorhabdus sp.]
MIRYTRAARALAICLAGLAGFVDAVGFLQTGGLFVSFMSGNSTRLAVGLAEAVPVAGLAAQLIVSFVVGVVLGGLLAARWPAVRKALVLAVVALLIALAAGMESLGFARLMLVPLAMAMGCINNVFQRDGDVTIGVTYMTGALVRAGQRIADALRGGPRWDWLPFLLLWTGLVAGAIVGALLFARFGVPCLWIAAAAAALLSLWGGRLQLREGR